MVSGGLVSLVSGFPTFGVPLLMLATRIVSCPYVSSMMILVTNNLHNLLHHRIQLDSRLVDKGLQWLKAGAEETQREDVRILRDICVDIVQRVEHKRAVSISITQSRILL